MRKLILILLSFYAVNSKAQDVLFTNTNQSLIYLNPSFAGTNEFVRIQAATRFEGINHDNTFKTGFSSIDFFNPKIDGGFAFSGLYDKYNDVLIHRTISFAYAQHIWLYDKKLKIIPSLQPSVFMKTLDVSQITFGDMMDGRYRDFWKINEAIPQLRKSGLDLNAGLLLQGKNTIAGVAVFHINQPDHGLLGASRLPLRINLHGAYNFRFSDKVTITPNLVAVTQATFSELYLNVNASYNQQLFFGAGFRKSNAVTINLSFQFEFLKIGAGIDHSLNEVDPQDLGTDAFEFFLSFNLQSKRSSEGPIKDWLLW